MAKSNVERQRDWRARQREKRGTVPMMAVSAHEAFRAKMKVWAEAQQVRVAELEAELGAAQEQLAGKRVPPCRQCGGELACPQCWRGDDF